MPFNIYTQDDINKKIIEPRPITYGPEAQLGQLDLFRQDEYSLYLEKRQEFLDAAAVYKESNRMALCRSKTKLDADSENILRYPQDYTKSHKDYCRCSRGRLLRKRSLRPIHEDKCGKLPECSTEPWFHRYLLLSKFVHAARTIILVNRMVKRLMIFRTLDKDTVNAIENQKRRIENVSYPKLFEKFIE